MHKIWFHTSFLCFEWILISIWLDYRFSSSNRTIESFIKRDYNVKTLNLFLTSSSVSISMYMTWLFSRNFHLKLWMCIVHCLKLQFPNFIFRRISVSAIIEWFNIHRIHYSPGNRHVMYTHTHTHTNSLKKQAKHKKVSNEWRFFNVMALTKEINTSSLNWNEIFMPLWIPEKFDHSYIFDFHVLAAYDGLHCGIQ